MSCAQHKQQLWRHPLCLFMFVAVLAAAIFVSPVGIGIAADPMSLTLEVPVSIVPGGNIEITGS